jgi:hypothetical protein
MADPMPVLYGNWPCPLHGPQKVLAVYPKQIPITSWVDGPAACHVEWCTDCGGYGYTVAIHGVVQIGGFWDTPQAAIGAAYRAMDAISIELATNA